MTLSIHPAWPARPRQYQVTSTVHPLCSRRQSHPLMKTPLGSSIRAYSCIVHKCNTLINALQKYYAVAWRSTRFV